MAKGPKLCTKKDAFDICACDDCMQVFMKKPANETPQIDLLERDVLILFEEVRRLRSENNYLKTVNGKLKKHIEESEKEEKEELSFYITNQRKALKMSRDDLGRKSGMSGDTIKNIEEGKGNLIKMREIVNVIQKLKGVKV